MAEDTSKNIPKNLCPRCKNSLSEIRPNFHAAKMLGMIAYCPTCHLPFTRFFRGKEYDSGWFSTRIPLEQIGEKLSEHDIQVVEEITGKFKMASKNWVEFLSYSLESDAYYFYEDLEQEKYGVVMKRGEEFVLNYPLVKYLYNRVKRNI